MNFISELEGAFGWIGAGGIYKQVPLYRRGEALYAKWGGGYIRLRGYGATSAPKVIWQELDGGDLHNIDTTQGKDPSLVVQHPAAAKLAAE